MMFYREVVVCLFVCLFTEVSENGNLKLVYVDYGNTEVVYMDCVYRLPTDILQIRQQVTW